MQPTFMVRWHSDTDQHDYGEQTQLYKYYATQKLLVAEEDSWYSSYSYKYMSIQF